jgi:arylsulfatase
MVNLWYAEAGANEGFPLDDRSAFEIFTAERPQLTPARARYVYFPNHAEVPEAQAVTIRGRSFVIGALVDLPTAEAEGVLFAQGSRFGGHALYVKDNRLHYVNSFVGMFEQMVVASEDLPIGTDLILSASFEKESNGTSPVAEGTLSLYHGDKKVGEGPVKTQPGGYMIAGEGLAIGRDVGDQVTEDYPGERPYPFTGGTIKRVAIDVSGQPYIDLEREAAGMLMRE